MNKISLFVLFFILTFPYYVNNKIIPYTYFMAIPNENNSIILFTEYQVLLLNYDFTLNKEILSFDFPQIRNREFLETVNIQNYHSNQHGSFLIELNSTYYTFNPLLNVSNYAIYYPIQDYLLPYKCYNTNKTINCTALSISIVNSENLIYLKSIQLIGENNNNIKTEKGFMLVNGNGKSAKKYSENMGCELMEKNSNNYFVCFYELNSLELVATSFDVGSNEANIGTSITHKYSENEGFNYIKTVVSPYSKNITLIAYITTNSSYNLNCLLYNFSKNEFTAQKYMMSSCRNSLVDFGLVKNTKNIEKKEYLVYCHVTDIKIQYILFNETVVENQEELNTYYFELKDCKELYSSCAVFIEKTENYYFMYSCKNEKNETITNQELLIGSTNETFNKTIDIITNNTINSVDNNNTNYTLNTIINNMTNNNTNIINNNINTINKNSNTINNNTNKSQVSIEDNSNKIVNFEFYEENNETIKGNISLKKAELEGNIEEIIKEIEIGKNYEIKGDDFEIKIHPINTDLGSNKTNINFSECETILREKNNISDDKILTTLQIEIESKIENSLTNKVEYAVYDENKTKLDLSFCEKIIINYEIKNSSLLDEDLISSFSKIGVDILNIEDNFFNDICFPFDVNQTDVVLEDRQSDIYQNYSICDSNCTYNNINLTSNIITCTCTIKSNISVQEENPNFGQIIENTFKDSNFAIIHCYNIIFDTITANKGFIIFGILIIGHILLFTYYFLSGVNSVYYFVIEEMKKYNYISKTETDKKRKKVSSPIKKKKPNKIKAITNKKSNKVKSKLIDSINSNLYISGKSENSLKKIHRKILAASKDENDNSKKKIKIKKKTKLTTSILNNNSLNPASDIKFKEENFPGYYNLILVDLNKKKVDLPPYSKFVLNYYNYKQAIKYDMRDFWRIVFICMLHRQSILHTFFFKTDLEPQSLRICLFVFHYSCDFFLNALFYSTTKISDRYQYEGDYLFFYSLVNNLTISLFSTLTSFVLRLVLKYLINSKRRIEKIFRQEEKIMFKNKKAELPTVKKNQMVKKIKGIISCLKIKIIIFILIEFPLMIFFTYYITVFCAVYGQTQISWITDSVISLLMSNLLDLLISFAVAGFYSISLRAQVECLYNVVIFIYDFGH